VEFEEEVVIARLIKDEKKKPKLWLELMQVMEYLKILELLPKG